MALRPPSNALFCVCLFATIAQADQADQTTLQTVANGLNEPSAVAIRPGGAADRYEVFVALRGAGRVVKYISGEDRPQPAITGFHSNAADISEPNSTGPWALAFLDRMTLIVAAGGGDRDTLVRAYELHDDESIEADAKKQHAGVATQDGIRRGTDALAIHAAARTIANDRVPDLLIFTATGDERQRGLWKMPIRAGSIGELVPFAAEADASEATTPTAITIGEHGFVVVARSADGDESPSELAFYNPIDGSRLMRLSCELPRIVALAYSPRTGNLYAAAGSTDDSDGSIYRLDDASQPGAPACSAIGVVEVSGPTAMAFAPDGALYVTANDNDGDEGANNGILLKLTGEL